MGAVLRVRNKKTNEMVDYVQEKMIQFSEIIRVTDNMSSYDIRSTLSSTGGKVEVMVQQSGLITNTHMMPTYAKMIKNIRIENGIIKWDKTDMDCRFYPTMVIGVS